MGEGLLAALGDGLLVMGKGEGEEVAAAVELAASSTSCCRSTLASMSAGTARSSSACRATGSWVTSTSCCVASAAVRVWPVGCSTSTR
jgi:hypothetical protein